jgi:hypothetical protein
MIPAGYSIHRSYKVIGRKKRIRTPGVGDAVAFPHAFSPTIPLERISSKEYGI